MRTASQSVLIIFFLLLAQMSFFSATAEETSDNGYPKTIEDSLGREIVIDKPIERIIALGNYRTEAVKALGAASMLVGIDDDSIANNHYFPELVSLPRVGSWKEPDAEAIAKLDPDIVITSANSARLVSLEESLRPLGITVIGLDFYRDNSIKSEVEKLGFILDKEDAANDYIQWREGYENIISNYVSGLSKDEMPTVYLEWSNVPGKSYGTGSSGQVICDFVGARNIAEGLDEFPTVEMEWIISQNPDYIIKTVNLGGSWGWNSTSEAQADLEGMTSRTGWKSINAVKDNHIYIIGSEIAWGLDSLVFAAYCAKWYHPDIDLDPLEIYKYYLKHFLNIDYPDGLIIAYPAPE